MSLVLLCSSDYWYEVTITVLLVSRLCNVCNYYFSNYYRQGLKYLWCFTTHAAIYNNIIVAAAVVLLSQLNFEIVNAAISVAVITIIATSAKVNDLFAFEFDYPARIYRRQNHLNKLKTSFSV